MPSLSKSSNVGAGKDNALVGLVPARTSCQSDTVSPSLSLLFGFVPYIEVSIALGMPSLSESCAGRISIRSFPVSAIYIFPHGFTATSRGAFRMLDPMRSDHDEADILS